MKSMELDLIKELVDVVLENGDSGEIDDDVVGKVITKYNDVILKIYHDPAYGNDWVINLSSGIQMEMCVNEGIDLYWRLGLWK